MTQGEDFIHVFFHGPGSAHPPTGHLVDDHVGPEKFLHFFGGVVTTVDEGFLDVETGTVEKRQGGFMQGCVVAAIGVGELFATIEQQELFHGLPHLCSAQDRGPGTD
ncbi:hypothetical protein D3C80_1831610 [compost metagenome]